MAVLFNGKLKLIGNHIYYHFTDEFGCYERRSLKMKVDALSKNAKGEWIFPPKAIAVARQIDDDVRAGRWGLKKPAVKRTMPELLKEYYELDGNRISEGSKLIYNNVVKKFTNVYGALSIDKINSDTLVHYRNYLIKEKKNNDYTIAKDFRHLASLFAFALRRSYMALNPVNRYNRPHPQKKIPEIYSAAELTAIFNYLHTHSPDAMYQCFFLLLTGFRAAESCHVTWQQIDWTNHCILHHNEKGRRDELYPMSDVLFSFLAEYPRTFDPYIFKYRNQANLFEQIRRARESCGITKKKAIHLFKKNYSTSLANAGTPSYILPDLAHHTSITVTKDAYLYIDLDEKRKWLNASHKNFAGLLQNTTDQSDKVIPLNATRSK